MPFPTTPLPLITEVLINGKWTVVNDGVTVFDRRIADGLTITRGRRDWSSRVTASQCTQVFENADGKYSNRNPLSPYFGLLGRNTQLRHRNRWLYDNFSRTLTDSWGSTEGDTPAPWVNTGGTVPSEYDVNGFAGTHTHGTVNQQHNSLVTPAFPARDVMAACNWSALATGAAYTTWVALGADDQNYYAALLEWGTGGTVKLEIVKRVAGVLTVLTSLVTVGAYTPGVDFTARLSVRPNGIVRAKAWPGDLVDEPSTSWTVTVTDTSLAPTSLTKVGLLSRREAGNTNVNPVCSWLEVQGGSYRFWGETSAFAPAWDASGSDVTAPVEAVGVLQRLSTGAKPLRSAMYRGIPLDNPLAWWPLETDAKSGLPGGIPMSQSGQVNFGANSGHPGSAPLPDYSGGGQLKARLPNGAASNSWRAEFTARFGTGSNSVNNFTTVVDINSPNGDVNAWEFFVTDAATVVGAKGAAFQWSNTSGSYTGVIQTDALVDDGRWHHFRADVAQSGGNIQVTFTVDGTIYGASTLVGKNLNSTDSNVVINPLLEKAAYVGEVGHFTWWSPHTPTSIETSVLATGHNGETAAGRIARLCDEAGIPFELVGNAADTEAMGPQQTGTLLDLLSACADVDQGVLFEPRDNFGLAYRTSASLYNQTGPAVSYTSGKLGLPFQPVEDDQLLVNDVTVSRINGASARYVVTDGPLSTQDPPNGVGTYDVAPSVNLFADEQCFLLASWLGSKGTWDEARYPSARFQMTNPALAADTSLSVQLAALDIGDVFSVTNLPAWQPPGAAGLMVQGTTEFVGDGKDWALGFNCTPSGPYATGVYDIARYDSDVTTAAEDLDTTETAVDIQVAGPNSLWVNSTANPTEFPFLVTIDGEDMNVTAATAPVVTFVGAGTAAHADNAQLTPGLPAGLQLGDLLLVYAACRATSGSPNTPAGYTLLFSDTNIELFGKIAGASEVAPTITFSGTVLGDTTSAQMAAFRGVDPTVLSSAVQSNAAGQNIATPALTVPRDYCLIIWLGWKQSDMSGTTFGFSKIADAASPLGGDQSITWWYQVQGTPASDRATNTITVSGVASAISKAAVLALPQNRQTLTVTRSANGIVKAHSYGAPVHVKNPGRYSYT